MSIPDCPECNSEDDTPHRNHSSSRKWACGNDKCLIKSFDEVGCVFHQEDCQSKGDPECGCTDVVVSGKVEDEYEAYKNNAISLSDLKDKFF